MSNEVHALGWSSKIVFLCLQADRVSACPSLPSKPGTARCQVAPVQDEGESSLDKAIGDEVVQLGAEWPRAVVVVHVDAADAKTDVVVGPPRDIVRLVLQGTPQLLSACRAVGGSLNLRRWTVMYVPLCSV